MGGRIADAGRAFSGRSGQGGGWWVIAVPVVKWWTGCPVLGNSLGRVRKGYSLGSARN